MALNQDKTEPELDPLYEINCILEDPTLTVKVQRALLRHKLGLSEEVIEALCPKDQVRY